MLCVYLIYHWRVARFVLSETREEVFPPFNPIDERDWWLIFHVVLVFIDWQFPLDLNVVERDHPFLDVDSLQALFRRLATLNRMARLRSEKARSRPQVRSSSKTLFCLFYCYFPPSFRSHHLSKECWAERRNWPVGGYHSFSIKIFLSWFFFTISMPTSFCWLGVPSCFVTVSQWNVNDVFACCRETSQMRRTKSALFQISGLFSGTRGAGRGLWICPMATRVDCSN